MKTGWEYYGVELDPEECPHSLDHGTAIPLTDDWQCGWPLLASQKSSPAGQEKKA